MPRCNHTWQTAVLRLFAFLPALLALALAACTTRSVCTLAAAYVPAPFLAVADGMAYAYNGRLSALDAAAGKVRWRSPVASVGIPGSVPVIADGMVFAGTDVGVVTAWNASTGAQLWRSQPLPRPREATGIPFAAPVVAGGVVYAGAGYDTIAAWNARDGTLLWQGQPVPDAAPDPAMNTRAGLTPVPVVADGVVYFSAGHAVYALHAVDGTALWQSPALPFANAFSAPVLADGRIYVAARDGSAYALDAHTGAVVWHSPALTTAGPVLPEPAPNPVVENGAVYFSFSDSVRALAAATGAALWTSSAMPGLDASRPVVDGGLVFVVWGEQVNAFDAHTGKIDWQAPTRQPRSPIVAQGVVLAETSDGLAGWRASDGTKLWQHAAALSNGHVVVAADTLYLSEAGQSNPCGGSPVWPAVSALRIADGAALWRTNLQS